jgi:hypothetical protein
MASSPSRKTLFLYDIFDDGRKFLVRMKGTKALFYNDYFCPMLSASP